MHGVGGLPPPSTPPLVLKRASNTRSVSFSLLFQHQTPKAMLSVLPESLSNYSSLFHVRNGFCLFAQKKRQGSSIGSFELEKEDLEEEDEFEIDENEDDFVDENGDFDEEDEGDDLIVPFHKMLKKKPRGFGQGKAYDTSLEDKLLEEIEKAKKAQIANINRLKNESNEPKPEPKPEPKKELKVSEVVPSGIRVRINNLPKKKNIHRDLKSAFGGVTGIINISPVVSGNKKTKDPVCKGFGFVDFKSLEDANRFIQMFSGQNITFGKIDKNIKCEILKSPAVSEDEGDQELDVAENDPRSQTWEDEDYDNDSDDGEFVDNVELLSETKQGDSDFTELEINPQPELLSKHREKTKAVKKKSVVKKKQAKLNIPGSAKRLKVREKAKLADVFSRYGVKEALASKEM